ncbi:beta-lactamase class A [Haloactinopolyspora alba]|uniref:Beta-lactamase class A n=1 Tax=Haloactinopolyspora alba TaxID=648780 RepID=A0A2P8E5P7_9ACTN|nr:beta-lactamase class A [Haloactinopolyspora alba]
MGLAADALRGELDALARRSPGRWAFSVRESGRPVASVSGSVVMPAASTVKVALLALVLVDVAAGERSLDDPLPVPDRRAGGTGVLDLMPSVRALPLGEALELMIGVSDNTATNMVIDALDLDEAGRRIVALGASSTLLRRHLMDTDAARAGRDNVTTADDQALILDRLAGPDLLPQPWRRYALDVLGRQQFNDRIPAGVGPDVRCAHKTGELPGVRHDVGVLEFDGRSVVLAALGSELTDPVSQGAGTGPAGGVISTAADLVVAAVRSDGGGHGAGDEDGESMAERATNSGGERS